MDVDSRQRPSFRLCCIICDIDFQDMFSTLCHIEADISAVPKVIKRNKSGVLYFEQLARVVLLFGSTELKAQLCWDQDVCCFIYPDVASTSNHGFSFLQGEEKR